MFKIYTKTGDKGGTSLIGGVRVPKNHIRIESYGTIDELNSYMGMVSDLCNNDYMILSIQNIQDRLFTIGSELAVSPDKIVKMKLPSLYEEDIIWLENEIDSLNEVLPEMRSFILPGGCLCASTCHVARSICRRAERICVSMQENSEVISPLIIKYLNRLSDYLFVLARFITYMNNGVELEWKAKI